MICENSLHLLFHFITFTTVLPFHSSKVRSLLSSVWSYAGASGSSSGSWYCEKYEWDRASLAEILPSQSSTSMRFNKSTAKRGQKQKEVKCRAKNYFLFFFFFLLSSLWDMIRSLIQFWCDTLPSGLAPLNIFSRSCGGMKGKDWMYFCACKAECRDQHILR